MFLRLYFVNNGKKSVKMRVNLNVRLNQQFFSLCQNFLFTLVFACLVVDFK